MSYCKNSFQYVSASDGDLKCNVIVYACMCVHIRTVVATTISVYWYYFCIVCVIGMYFVLFLGEGCAY